MDIVLFGSSVVTTVVHTVPDASQHTCQRNCGKLRQSAQKDGTTSMGTRTHTHKHKHKHKNTQTQTQTKKPHTHTYTHDRLAQTEGSQSARITQLSLPTWAHGTILVLHWTDGRFWRIIAMLRLSQVGSCWVERDNPTPPSNLWCLKWRRDSTDGLRMHFAIFRPSNLHHLPLGQTLSSLKKYLLGTACLYHWPYLSHLFGSHSRSSLFDHYLSPSSSSSSSSSSHHLINHPSSIINHQ